MGKEYYRSPIGVLEIITDGSFLTNINLVDKEAEAAPNSLTGKVKMQLIDYFEGKLKAFDLPIKFNGKGFCLKVWECIKAIPYGKTVTYGELSAMAGSAKAYRSAGSCAGKNPIPIVVPCHRVVASNGIGGFGLGTEVKKFLLAHESNNSIVSG